MSVPPPKVGGRSLPRSDAKWEVGGLAQTVPAAPRAVLIAGVWLELELVPVLGGRRPTLVHGIHPCIGNPVSSGSPSITLAA